MKPTMMTTSISSEAFEEEKTESKYNTVNKKHKWKNGHTELLIISDPKKLRNEEKHLLENYKPYLLNFFINRSVFYSLTSHTDRQKFID